MSQFQSGTCDENSGFQAPDVAREPVILRASIQVFSFEMVHR